MNTFQTNAYLEIFGFSSPIPIQVDYVCRPHIGAIHSVGDEIVIPAEPGHVEIFAVRGKFRNKWFGIAHKLTQEQYEALQDTIEDSIKEDMS